MPTLSGGNIVENLLAAGESAMPSAAARQRMLGVRSEPLFLADWWRAVFMHFEVDAEALQRAVPFELDLWEGRAYLSLVAFTMRGMRPRRGGKLGAWLLKPIATNNFLNVRAYVKHRGEPGIHFLAEWMDHPISVHLGPAVFGLPYRFGRLKYDHRHESREISGEVADRAQTARLVYRAEMDTATKFTPCAAGSLDEFLVERYTAFNVFHSAFRAQHSAFFRIWHPPWPQMPINLSLVDTSLMVRAWPWFADAKFVGANYSPGIRGVWMGRPQSVKELTSQ